jgi:polysaccharide transporter, PST family
MFPSILRQLVRKDQRRILENFLSLSMLQVATYVLPLVTVTYLVRVVGAEKFGLLSFAQSLLVFFSIFVEYGFSLSATKEIAVCREDLSKVSEIFCSVMLLKLMFLVTSFLITGLLVLAVPRFRSDWVVYLFTFGTVAGTAAFPAWFFQGIERMSYISLLNILGKVLYTAAIFVVIRKASDFVYVPLLSTAGMFVAGGWALWLVFYRLGVRLVLPARESIFRQFREGWPVFVSGFAVAGYVNIRVFAVGLFGGNEVTGYYKMAEQLIAIAQMFPIYSLFQAIYPRLSKLYTENASRSLSTMKRFQNGTNLAYLAVLPLLAWLAPGIVRLVFGKPYEITITAFHLLLVSVFFMNAYIFTSNFLLIMGRSRLYMRVFLVAGSIGAAGVLVSGRFLGYVGVITSVNLVAVGIFLWMTFFFRRLGKTPMDSHSG